MLKINDNLYVNQANIVKAIKVNSEYYLILTSDVKIRVSKEIYDSLKGDVTND